MGVLAVVERALIAKSLPRALAPPSSYGGGGVGRDGWARIWEPFAGAWQRNISCSPETALSYSAVFACVTRISSDIAKLRFMLTTKTDGVTSEVTVSAFSPVLAKPNHYQTHIQFKETWQNSLSRSGNTYVLLRRDGRGVVTEMFVLDPARVQPLVASDGSVFYSLSGESLADVQESIVVPASEIIHDRFNCLFHPLIGLSPLFAAALSAGLGLEIERNSATFFANGAKISGVITAPGAISDAAAKAVSEQFNAGYTKENAGKVAILGDGLKFQQLTMSATDAQLIELLKKTAEDVCSAFHVPAYRVGFAPVPSNNNIEALTQQYYDDCLQIRIESMEALLNEGLGLTSKGYSIELDLDGLLRMDTATKFATYGEGIKNSILSPNEARRKLNYGKVPGGDSPLAQQQEFSLEALSKRDAPPNPFVVDKPVSTPTPAEPETPTTPAPDPAEADDKAYRADVTKHMLIALAREVEHGFA